MYNKQKIYIYIFHCIHMCVYICAYKKYIYNMFNININSNYFFSNQ